MSLPPLKILLAFGTRPEAVKLAPIIVRLGANPAAFNLCLVTTAQHREMLDQVLQVFDLHPDYDLNLMQPNQTLPDLTYRVLTHLTPVLQQERPDLLLVQGDTTTVLMASLAAFYEQIPVGHVEAGLRTDNRYDPFPEEMNRRLTTRLSSLHFAPTETARQNLLAEGVPADQIYVTGNPVIDALQSITRRGTGPLPPDLPPAALANHRLLLVTAHRRENWGEPLEAICRALGELAGHYPDTVIVYAVHRNPLVRTTVHRLLDGRERVYLIQPPNYVTFVELMRRAYLILTDSGGLQEEAPALGVPVLVLRRTTERPEGIAAGTAQLVGTETEAIVAAAGRLLEDKKAYQHMARAVNPYGDGQAAERIEAALLHYFGRCDQRPPDFVAG
ncbi:MAG TPA: UDP-N-acetylglucosamine 2-epimerase (non-hydrolyzing) [Armatimonadetes bacterium]|nr:UDP-N-acetylglucosamine 2-epimerase (non-hydrolyzing) [Armatimonadota bacterium]